MSLVLVVEDDEHLAEGLAFNLRNGGYEVETVETGEEALERVASGGVDLVLLDLMLPGIDGLEVARRLRRAGHMLPILVLTARSRPDDVIAGLDAGADDYVTKPFDLDEVLARIRSGLRRRSWSKHVAQAHGPGTLRYGSWLVEFDKFTAKHDDGREITLTVTEAAMLRLFAQRPDRVITRELFLREVWERPDAHAHETRTVDNFIRRLRRALEPDPARPRHIVSVRGAGYRFVP